MRDLPRFPNPGRGHRGVTEHNKGPVLFEGREPDDDHPCFVIAGTSDHWGLAQQSFQFFRHLDRFLQLLDFLGDLGIALGGCVKCRPVAIV